MKFEAQVSLKEPSGEGLSALDIPLYQSCELVHSSGRKGNIKTGGVVLSGDAKALFLNIDYKLENGNLTVADFEDDLIILNGGINLKVSSIH